MINAYKLLIRVWVLNTAFEIVSSFFSNERIGGEVRLYGCIVTTSQKPTLRVREAGCSKAFLYPFALLAPVKMIFVTKLMKIKENAKPLKNENSKNCINLKHHPLKRYSLSVP